MAKKKSKTTSLPRAEDIKGKLKDFNNYADDILSGKKKLPGTKPTIQDRLDLIKDILMKFNPETMKQHNPAVKPIPYSAIRQMLMEQLDLKVSEQSLRSYCQNMLDFPKKIAVKKKTTERVPGFSVGGI